MSEELTAGNTQGLRAQAIAVRGYALHLIEVQGNSSVVNYNQHQVFPLVPRKLEQKHYQTAQDTRGWLLTCNQFTGCPDGRIGTPIFAEHSSGHAGGGEYTVSNPDDYQHPYLLRVWDPIHTGGGGHGHGISHQGVLLWETGQFLNNNYYPAWDYRHILAHYYSKVTFQGVPNVDSNYRFNIIRSPNLDLRPSSNPNDNNLPRLDFTEGNTSRNNLTMWVQNSGIWSWPLNPADNCRDTSETQTALGYHIYNMDGTIACPRCFGWKDRAVLCDNQAIARQTSSLQPGQTIEVSGFTLKLPIGETGGLSTDKGRCYLIRLDIDLRFNNKWLSGITANTVNQTAPYWPLPEIKVCYEVDDSGGGNEEIVPPEINEDDTDKEGWYNNHNTIKVGWNDPNPNSANIIGSTGSHVVDKINRSLPLRSSQSR